MTVSHHACRIYRTASTSYDREETQTMRASVVQPPTRIAWFAVVCALWSVGAMATAWGEPASPETGRRSGASLKMLATDLKALPRWLPWNVSFYGDVIDGSHWSDRNGENLVLLSQKSTNGGRQLFATHFVRVTANAPYWAGPWLVQSHHVLRQPCPEDLVLKGHMLGVFDVDRDRIGEAAFTIESACISDVSPLDFDLHIWESGSDYALFGRTLVCADAAFEREGRKGPPRCRDSQGGDILFSPNLSQAPPKIRALAAKLWAEHIPVAGPFTDEVICETRLDLLKRTRKVLESLPK